MPALIEHVRISAAAIFAALFTWSSTSHALSEHECSCLQEILRLPAPASEALIRESERIFDELCADVSEFEIYDSISSSMVAEMACEVLHESPLETDLEVADYSEAPASISVVVSTLWTFQQRQLGGQIEWRQNVWFDVSLRLEFNRRRAAIATRWSGL